jgi:starch phosphorylase
MKARGYNPWDCYNKSPNLKRVIDLIHSGFFSPEEPQLFMPIYDSLLNNGDRYMIMADFDSYIECQNKISMIYRDDQAQWTKMSILNVANMGKFSSDRAIKEYADEIWNVKPIDIKLEK